MFRFNPGQEKKMFPPKNAYQPKHCNGDKVNLTGLLGHSRFVLNSENEKCQAKKVVEEMARGKEISNKIIESRNEVKIWASKQEFPLKIKSNLDFINVFTIPKSSIKTMISKWHPDPILRDKFVKNIMKNLPKCGYYAWAEDEIINGKQKHQNVDFWIYLNT